MSQRQASPAFADVPFADQDAALLALGRWFMGRSDLDFRVTSRVDEVRAVLRLRRRHVEAAGWEAASRSSPAEEKDDVDGAAIHLTAWDGDVLAGAARLILPTEVELLPTEAAFGLRVEPVDGAVECGRWIVGEAYRDPAHGVSMGLSGLACLEVVSRGYTVWAGMTTARVIDLWRGFGFAMETLTPPRAVLGVQRVAVRCDLRASLPGLLDVLAPFGAPMPEWAPRGN